MTNETPPPDLPQAYDPTSRDQDGVLSIASSFEPTPEPSPPHPPPSTSHLTPCSWEDFLEQDFGTEHHVDLVSGFSVRRSVMADREHQDIITHLTSIINQLSLLVYAYFTPPTKVADYDEASSSDSPQRKIPGKREPDIALKFHNEESSSSVGSPKKKKMKFSGDRPPAAVVEVTSSSTRSEDLYEKWATYSRTRFPLYIILDRTCVRAANGVHDGSPRVIVGSVEKRSEWEVCSNGDPEQSPKKTRKHSTGSPRAAQYYYRKVFKGDQIPDCPYLRDLGLTVSQLLDKKFLLKKIWRLRIQRENTDRGKREAEEWAGKAETSLQEETQRRKALERKLKKMGSLKLLVLDLSTK